MEVLEEVSLNNSMRTYVDKSSSNSSLSVHTLGTPWNITEKRMLIAEARQWGIRPTARRRNMSFSTLSNWMLEDFCGDLPGTEKQLVDSRRLRYNT